MNVKPILLAAAVAALCSCSAIKRVLVPEERQSNMPADTISGIYHPESVLLEAMHPCSIKGPARRRMLVYLPSDYEKNATRRYPVLYLLHGARGNESSWIFDGDILRITDSLRRGGLVEQAIIVMPNMNQYFTDQEGETSRFKRPLESFFQTDGCVETAFMNDVVGFVDKHFRTIPDKQHRAIAGLSIGALQSIFISAHNADAFDYIGLFSPMYKSPIMKSEYSSFYSGLKDLQEAQFASAPKVYAIMIGRWDFFWSHNEYFRRYLRKYHRPFSYYETSGGHDWKNWKNYVTIFSQECFR